MSQVDHFGDHFASKINAKSNANIEAEQMRTTDENILKIDATTVGLFFVFSDKK